MTDNRPTTTQGVNADSIVHEPTSRFAVCQLEQVRAQHEEPGGAMQINDTIPEHRSTRLMSAANTALVTVQLTFVTAATIVLAMWAIPPVRRWLIARGVFDDEALVPILELLVVLVLLILTTMVTLLRRIAANVETISVPSAIVIEGPLPVQQFLDDAIKTVPFKQRTVDILGMTGRDAWPQLETWLNLEDTSKWTIRLFCLAPEYAQRSDVIPDTWATYASSTCEGVEEFVEMRKDDLRRRQISLSLHQYEAFPGIHGFTIGNGWLAISCTQWRESSNELENPPQLYEVFRASDLSRRAKTYRTLFKNWLSHAERSVVKSVSS